jgi:hypothetical protein
VIEVGSIVVLSLSSPKEKYWGRLISLTQVGVQLRGLELPGVTDWARELCQPEEPSMGLATVFFPLTRVEKIFLDEDAGMVPSVKTQVEKLVGNRLDDLLR